MPMSDKNSDLTLLPADMRQSGRTMLEMLGVLAIVAVLTVVGLASFSRALDQHRANKVMDQVSQLIINIRSMFASAYYYTGLNNSEALNLGLVPDDIVKESSGELKNPFKGFIYINPTNANKGDAPSAATAFEITYTGLSRYACIALATGEWSKGSEAGLISMMFSAAGTDASSDGASTTMADKRRVGCIGEVYSVEEGAGLAIACPEGAVRFPLTVSQAGTACNCVGDYSNRCSVTWLYF